MTSDLAVFQASVGKWHRRYYPEASSVEIALKLASGVGNLVHVCGLLHESFSPTAKRLEDEREAVANIVLVLAAYCEKRGIDMQTCIGMVWGAYPETLERGGAMSKLSSLETALTEAQND